MKLKDFQLLKESLEIDKLYFYCETFKKIHSYLKFHPDFEQKTSNGFNGYIYSKNKVWGNKNHCFYILDDDNNKIAISYLYNIKKNVSLEELQKREVLKAFRSTIFEEVKEFKKTFIPNVTKCAITGVVLKNNTYDVDHHNHDFAVVVEMFLKKYNKTYSDLYKYVIQHDTRRYFDNKNLRNYFIKFHNENTNLRFTTIRVNRSKKTFTI